MIHEHPVSTAEPHASLARLTVRLNAIADNYRTVRRIASGAGIAAVVKADAYGLGLRAVAPTLLRAGSATFVVARLSEGIALRTLAPAARIFVLDGAPRETIPALISYRLIPSLSSLAEIDAYAAAGRKAGAPLEAAVHIDTGMNRLGLPREELSTLAADPARRLDGLKVVLWMSHLACSDDAGAAMNAVQLERFRAALAMLPPAPASLAASGGILLGKAYQFDLVRPGIALYGGNPVPAQDNPFAVAVRCTVPILQVRRAPAGDTVGYGATCLLKRESRLATVAYGYADGLPRGASGRCFAALAGRPVPMAGRVSMDLATFDVTDAPAEPVPGMELELFGDTISLDAFAAASGTISYEILTNLSRRAERTYREAA